MHTIGLIIHREAALSKWYIGRSADANNDVNKDINNDVNKDANSDVNNNANDDVNSDVNKGANSDVNNDVNNLRYFGYCRKTNFTRGGGCL